MPCHTWVCCCSVRCTDNGCGIGVCGCTATGGTYDPTPPASRSVCNINLCLCGFKATESTHVAHTNAGPASVPQTHAPPVQQMQHHQQPATVTGYPQQQQQQAATAPTMPAFQEPLKPARNQQYPAQPAGNYQ